MIANAPIIYVWNSKIIQILYGRQAVTVKIQNTLYGGRNIENLIKSTCFNQNFSQLHVFLNDLDDHACVAMKIVQD